MMRKSINLRLLLPKSSANYLENRFAGYRAFSSSRINDMKVIVGGGSGFVGKHLHKTLASKGYEVQVISRTRGVGKITWDDIASNGLPECQAVVNLAGEQLLNPLKRWNNQLKEDLRKSRVDTTKLLAQSIVASSHPPEVFIGSSAVGIYPTDNVVEYTEEFPVKKTDYLTELCVDWESSAKLPDSCATRQVVIRIGVVLGKDGGIIQNVIWPFWFGVGGVIGSGRQPFPWIHVQDVCDIIAFAIDNKHVSGALNGVAPCISTNKDFTSAMGRVLRRPTIFPLPGFVVNAIFGGVRGSVMLEGQNVIPKRTMDLGYSFRFPDLESAVKDVVLK